MAKTSYKAEDIKILEGLDAVRMRPGMYIGTTSVKGLHHILWEIVDNAIDEAANGHANKIEIKLYKDGSVSVEDNGRGIPTDIHSKAGVSGVQVVFTQLHAGGKFGSDNYNYSGGLHGVGASVTNALSEWLTVQVYKDYVYEMSFHSYLDKETGKIYARRVGTAYERVCDTIPEWINNHEIPIRWGNITNQPNFHDYEGLNQMDMMTRNSKGKMVKIEELGWSLDEPTHIIVYISASNAGVFRACEGNTLWVDNLRFIYEEE